MMMEVPLEELITIEDPNYNSYKRTFLLEDGKVVYKNNLKQDYKQPNLEHRIILTCFGQIHFGYRNRESNAPYVE
jgi:hypothetical protein